LPSDVIAFGPGRVNLIGEHTDYNNGLALPFAISEGVKVTATPLSERRIEAIAADLDEQDEFDLDQPERADGWRAFVRGATAEMGAAGIELCGAKLVIEGNVPQGAGLSSSAALEVALAIALLGVAGAQEPDRIELAKLCSRVENDWVGARTGLLDQIASLCGEDKRALRIDFRSLEVTPVALELHDHKLVTLDSGEHHSNAAEGGYNERRDECAKACEELGIESLRDATLEMAEKLPAPLDARVRHVVSENERVEQAVEALSDGDLPRLGELLDASHESLRDLYDISTPAVEDAVARLRDSGAIGARIVGGGFGGYVLGLLPESAQPPDGAIEVRPGPGARLIDR
jgi:galactokinase